MSESGELIVSVYNSQTGTMVEKKSSELTPKERERIVAQFRGEDWTSGFPKLLDCYLTFGQANFMAQNVTNELIIEHLKQVQSKLSDMAIEISETRSDIRGLKGHVASMLQSEVSKDGEIAAIKLRIERIENRLELRS